MRYEITDSHRKMTAKQKQALTEFFREVKGIPTDEDALQQVYFCDWYEHDFAVSWFEVIAWDGPKAVGYIRVLRDPKDVRQWLSCDVHVRRDYRRRRIATRMYRKVIETLYSFEAAETLIAAVNKNNVKSINLHEKLGFRNTKRLCKFADFYVVEDDTKFVKPLYHYLPVRKNFEGAVERVLPIWTEWKEANGTYRGEEAEKETIRGLLKDVEDGRCRFDGLWRGNRMVGFRTQVGETIVTYNREE